MWNVASLIVSSILLLMLWHKRHESDSRLTETHSRGEETFIIIALSESVCACVCVTASESGKYEEVWPHY